MDYKNAFYNIHAILLRNLKHIISCNFFSNLNKPLNNNNNFLI